MRIELVDTTYIPCELKASWAFPETFSAVQDIIDGEGRSIDIKQYASLSAWQFENRVCQIALYTLFAV